MTSNINVISKSILTILILYITFISLNDYNTTMEEHDVTNTSSIIKEDVVIDTSILPSIVLMTINLGLGPSLKYKYLDMTLHSMQYNKDVDFIMIHVIDDDTYNSNINFEEKLILDYDIMNVLKTTTNFRIHRVSYSQLTILIKKRLHIDVEITDKHYYKMSEFKPTLAVLFSELLVNPKTSLEYTWWGYADLDLIWGRISDFSHLFHDQWPIINTGYTSPRGMCTFYKNLDWLNRVYLEDPMFLVLLKNITTHDLDENGKSVPDHLVIDNGIHSMKYMQQSLLERHGKKAYHGPSMNDRLFIEKIDSVRWAGPVRWFEGSLKTVHKNNEFSHFREIMYYHRADDFNIKPLKINRTELIEDMLDYGYLLPYFVPLLTRYICPKMTANNYVSNFQSEINNYRPYQSICFNKKISK